MDDAGYKLQKIKKEGGILFNLGQLLINMLPWVIKILGISWNDCFNSSSWRIFLHNVEYLHHLVENLPTPAIVNEFGAGIIRRFIDGNFDYNWQKNHFTVQKKKKMKLFFGEIIPDVKINDEEQQHIESSSYERRRRNLS